MSRAIAAHPADSSPFLTLLFGLAVIGLLGLSAVRCVPPKPSAAAIAVMEPAPNPGPEATAADVLPFPVDAPTVPNAPTCPGGVCPRPIRRPACPGGVCPPRLIGPGPPFQGPACRPYGL